MRFWWDFVGISWDFMGFHGFTVFQFLTLGASRSDLVICPVGLKPFKPYQTCGAWRRIYFVSRVPEVDIEYRRIPFLTRYSLERFGPCSEDHGVWNSKKLGGAVGALGIQKTPRSRDFLALWQWLYIHWGPPSCTPRNRIATAPHEVWMNQESSWGIGWGRGTSVVSPNSHVPLEVV